MSRDKKKVFPFDKDGNLLKYVGYYLSDDEVNFVCENGELLKSKWNCDVVWKPQSVFLAEMKYCGFCRGQSACTFEWEDEHGHKYPMFAKDLDYMIKNRAALPLVDASWTYVQRGSNYGLKFDGFVS